MGLQLKLLSVIGAMIAIALLPYLPNIVIAQVDNNSTTNSDQEPEGTFAPIQTRSDPVTSFFRLFPYIIIAAVVAPIAIAILVLLKKRHKRV